jgi:hypothetical protein
VHTSTESTATTSSVLSAQACLIGSELPPLPRYGALVLHFLRASVLILEHLALSGGLRATFTELGS